MTLSSSNCFFAKLDVDVCDLAFGGIADEGEFGLSFTVFDAVDLVPARIADEKWLGKDTLNIYFLPFMIRSVIKTC